MDYAGFAFRMYYSYLWINLFGFEVSTSWQTKRLAIHFARLCLLGHSLISCPSQKFLLWLHSLQTIFPALSLSCVSRAVLVRNAYEKKRAEFRFFRTTPAVSASHPCGMIAKNFLICAQKCSAGSFTRQREISGQNQRYMAQ